MSTSIDECRAYPCPNCGADVNPMTDVCRECGWTPKRVLLPALVSCLLCGCYGEHLCIGVIGDWTEEDGDE